MRYIKLDASAKLDELTALAYRVKAATPDSTLNAARTALLLANPGLKGKKTIPMGTVVLVPDVATVPPAGDSEPVAMPLADRGLFTGKQIEKLAEQAAAAASAAKEKAAETARHLKSSHFRKLIAEYVPELQKSFVEIGDNAKRETKVAATRVRRLDKVFEKMTADMKRLRDRMG